MGFTLLTNIAELSTMVGDSPPQQNVDLLAQDDQILWFGPSSERPDIPRDALVEALDCTGKAALPGLVDSHTHLVFGHHRADEFALRVAGASYEEIAAAGGGIRSTVAWTRQWSEEQLLAAALTRLDAMLHRGVTCVEVKSGYGLDMETELKMLRVIRRCNEVHPIEVVATFLGAHTVPAEFKGAADRYLDVVVNEMLPAVAEEGLARFCDVFCEKGVFTVAQARRVLDAGAALGLKPKLHAEQLHRTGATQLGVELGATSVDHLEFASDEDIRSLADSGQTAAVLLPGATLFLGLKTWAPARRLLDAGVPVALSTDCNPGSCMCDDLPLMTTLGCTQLGMSPAEALRAVTYGAAVATGEAHRRGSIEVGKRADIAILDAESAVQMPYRFGRVPLHGLVIGGEITLGPGRDIGRFGV